jgi:hypothetical protein
MVSSVDLSVRVMFVVAVAEIYHGAAPDATGPALPARTEKRILKLTGQGPP